MLVLGGTEGEIICADAEAWDGLQRALTRNQKNILRFLRSKPLSAASGVTSFKRAGDVLVGHSGVLTSWIDKCRKRRTRWRFKMFQEICKDESSTDWHQRQAVLWTVRGTVVSLGWVIGLIGYIGSYNGFLNHLSTWAHWGTSVRNWISPTLTPLPLLHVSISNFEHLWTSSALAT